MKAAEKVAKILKTNIGSGLVDVEFASMVNSIR